MSPARKPSRGKLHEEQSPRVKVNEVRYSLGVGMERPYVAESRPGPLKFHASRAIHLHGELSEAVAKRNDVVVYVSPFELTPYAEENMQSVGFAVRDKESITLYVSLPNPEFEALWALAVADRIRSAHLSLRVNGHGEGRISRCSFETEWDPDCEQMPEKWRSKGERGEGGVV